MLEQLALQLEFMASKNITDTPGFKFMRAMHANLHSAGMPDDIAMKVLTSMEIELEDFNIKDEVWQRIVASYTTIIMKFWAEFGENIVLIAPRLSINYSL